MLKVLEYEDAARPELLAGAAWCESCGELCPQPEDGELVTFCDECLEAADLRAYPEDWVMLGGWD